MQRLFDGQRILLLEDDYLQATEIAGFLSDEGAVVIGPIRDTIDIASEIAASKPTAAIVDISLGSRPSFAIAVT